MARRRQPRGLDRDQFAALIHGGAYPQLKRQLNPRQWQRLVREASRRGTTIEGMASGLPGPLRPLTRKGIHRQAMQTVNDAYRPAERDLDSQESRVRAIDEKRARDNQHYARWLEAQNARLRTEGAAADAALLRTEQEIATNVDQTYAESQKGARARAAAVAGNVSNPEQSLKLDMSPERQRAVETVANQRRQSAAQIGSGEKSSQFLQSSNALFMAAQDAKRQGQTFSALKDIADERGKVRFQKAADASKEIARLLDREITKAQSNREFSAATAKLGLDRAELQFDKQKFGKQHKLNTQEYLRKLSKDQIDARLKKIDLDLTREGLSETKRNNLVREQLRLREIISGGKDGKANKRDTTAWRQYRGLIGDARFYVKKKIPRDRIAFILSQEGNYDELLVHAAIDKAAHGKINPKRRKKIKQLYNF